MATWWGSEFLSQMPHFLIGDNISVNNHTKEDEKLFTDVAHNTVSIAIIYHLSS